jgi:hypothetical protein
VGQAIRHWASQQIFVSDRKDRKIVGHKPVGDRRGRQSQQHKRAGPSGNGGLCRKVRRKSRNGVG